MKFNKLKKKKKINKPTHDEEWDHLLGCNHRCRILALCWLLLCPCGRSLLRATWTSGSLAMPIHIPQLACQFQPCYCSNRIVCSPWCTPSPARPLFRWCCLGRRRHSVTHTRKHVDRCPGWQCPTWCRIPWETVRSLRHGLWNAVWVKKKTWCKYRLKYGYVLYITGVF